MLFKVGDRVKSNYTTTRLNKDQIYTVKYVFSNGYIETFEIKGVYYASYRFELVKENEMKPHVHAELIKKWADGATIQCFNSRTNNWDVVTNPSWTLEFQYRVKPKEDVVKGVYIYGYMVPHLNYYSEIKNVKLVFDGETNKLKSVEMIND